LTGSNPTNNTAREPPPGRRRSKAVADDDQPDHDHSQPDPDDGGRHRLKAVGGVAKLECGQRESRELHPVLGELLPGPRGDDQQLHPQPEHSPAATSTNSPVTNGDGRAGGSVVMATVSP
jgi:hypothetical protein